MGCGFVVWVTFGGWGWTCSQYKLVHFTLCCCCCSICFLGLEVFLVGVVIWLLQLVLWCKCCFRCFCWITMVCGFVLGPFCLYCGCVSAFADCCVHGLGAFKVSAVTFVARI